MVNSRTTTGNEGIMERGRALSFALRLLVLCTMLLAGSGSAVAAEFTLDSREYKLALEPRKFDFKNPGKTVDAFWEDKLKGIIADALGKTKKGKARHKGNFDDTKERQTVFRDTKDCDLDAIGYSVRERTKIKKEKLDPDSREMTLKFRTADVLIAWEALPEKGDTKFEEDIVPLLVRKIDAAGKETGAFAKPPSMRSIFSVSATEELEPTDKFTTVADVAKQFKDFRDRLDRAGGKGIAPGAALREGPVFHELVFKGAAVDLGEKIEADFDLSLWYRAGKFKTEAPVLAGAVVQIRRQGRRRRRRGRAARPCAFQSAAAWPRWMDEPRPGDKNVRCPAGKLSMIFARKTLKPANPRG